MAGTHRISGVIVSAGLAAGLALVGVGYGHFAYAAASASVTQVYTPPRQLYLNFWVPGNYAQHEFTVTLNNLPISFAVQAESTVDVLAKTPLASGTYTLSGTLAVNPSSGAIFPAATTTKVINRAGTALWRPQGIDVSTAMTLDAINAYRRAEGLGQLAWSAGLELAASHQREYAAKHPHRANSSTDPAATAGYAGSTPLQRASLAGYLGSAVAEWDGSAEANNPLALVAELQHGVFGRFFLMDPSAVRIGTAVDPDGTPVLDAGLIDPNPLSPAIQVDPAPGSGGVPTAWADRESPSPWPTGPAVTGYPIALAIEGWNITSAFSARVTTASGLSVPIQVVTDPTNPGMVGLIPKTPLAPDQRYRVSAQVSVSDPLTAIATTKDLDSWFDTVAAGLQLTTVSQSRRMVVGHSVLVQLSDVSATGNPRQVGMPIHWHVGPGLIVTAHTHTISLSGLAEALITATSAATSTIVAEVDGQSVRLPISMGLQAKSRAGLALKADRISGRTRLQTVAAIAIETARLDRTPPDEAILLADNPDVAVELSVLAPLAKAWNAPLLLTKSSTELGNATAAALSALNIRRVFTVGTAPALTHGTAAGITVVGALQDSNPIRLAASVADQLTVSGHPYHQAMILGSQSADWADGASAGAVAAENTMPIILEGPKGKIPQLEERALSPVTESFVVGAAAKSDPLVPSPVDLVGNDRDDTATLVDHEFYGNQLPAIIIASASSDHLVPALAAADLAAEIGAPMVLVSGSSFSIPTTAWLGQLRWTSHPQIEVIGSPAATASMAVTMVKGLIAG